ncbi:hypothetical protein M8818_002535 [Zalaria obscura]|uniref:Uncharacterized protein n=1 Tax=Zalaria obscura TaxID=2024903 RepID=A0ACC3SKK8_9PEZI
MQPRHAKLGTDRGHCDMRWTVLHFIKPRPSTPSTEADIESAMKREEHVVTARNEWTKLEDGRGGTRAPRRAEHSWLLRHRQRGRAVGSSPMRDLPADAVFSVPLPAPVHSADGQSPTCTASNAIRADAWQQNNQDNHITGRHAVADESRQRVSSGWSSLTRLSSTYAGRLNQTACNTIQYIIQQGKSGVDHCCVIPAIHLSM